uniref:Uncharacterized protein n=2 Tax=Physcomitrium patens TaxID=3218 RepID=A0A2K1L2F4_PHYPA|nr:hypothetical protein PHYPA_002989 [Physcomitrium patens]
MLVCRGPASTVCCAQQPRSKGQLSMLWAGCHEINSMSQRKVILAVDVQPLAFAASRSTNQCFLKLVMASRQISDLLGTPSFRVGVTGCAHQPQHYSCNASYENRLVQFYLQRFVVRQRAGTLEF